MWRENMTSGKGKQAAIARPSLLLAPHAAALRARGEGRRERARLELLGPCGADEDRQWGRQVGAVSIENCDSFVSSLSRRTCNTQFKKGSLQLHFSSFCFGGMGLPSVLFVAKSRERAS